MLSIYDYSDYRLFLKDYYESSKAVNPHFSFRYLSAKAGIKSPGFYKMIFDSKRNLSRDTIIKTCVALKLKDKEAEYFENLVLFCQAKLVKEKNRYFDKLITLQKLKDVRKIAPDYYNYFDEWYHCVVRELATMSDFKNDYRKLGRMVIPPITGKQAHDSIKLLLKLGYLKKVGAKYIQTSPLLDTGPTIDAHKVARFQKEMLKRAIDTIDNCPQTERLNSATTVRLSLKSLKQYYIKIRELGNTMMKIEKDSADAVYQLNLSFSPMGKLHSKAGDNND